jgi:hypothetical protein
VGLDPSATTLHTCRAPKSKRRDYSRFLLLPATCRSPVPSTIVFPYLSSHYDCSLLRPQYQNLHNYSILLRERTADQPQEFYKSSTLYYFLKRNAHLFSFSEFPFSFTGRSSRLSLSRSALPFQYSIPSSKERERNREFHVVQKAHQGRHYKWAGLWSKASKVVLEPKAWPSSIWRGSTLTLLKLPR